MLTTEWLLPETKMTTVGSSPKPSAVVPSDGSHTPGFFVIGLPDTPGNAMGEPLYIFESRSSCG